MNSSLSGSGGPGPLVLKGLVTAASLAAKLLTLEELRDAVTDAALERALARQNLNAAVTKLQGRLVEFNKRVRADFAGTAYERVLPAAFAVGDGEDSVRRPLREMKQIWLKINAISPAPDGVTLPILLLDNYAYGDFDADREALRGLYGALSTAEVNLKLAREKRNDLQEVIYEILKSYRLKVPTALPAGNALIDSLPLLNPPEGGHTPDAVVVEAEWSAATSTAQLTWSESTDADLKEYQVRAVPGPDYDTDDEAVLITVPAGGARTFATVFGLPVPGATASFKVYVVLKTGNERGSEPVSVTRP